MKLELRQVEKSASGTPWIYPTNVVFEAGGFNVLLGTTLAGKTTLMHLMAGLEKPSAGSLCFNDVDVTDVPVQKRNVSMVHQQFINYPNMRVFDNIASPLKVAGLGQEEIKKQVGQMAELLKISAMLDRYPSDLSGGQQQRTAMARALVKNADLVLLDEPLANLDFKLREAFRDELPKIFAERNCLVVYATTEPTEALLLGGNTMALYEGRCVDFGATHDRYYHPRDLTSAQVFSSPPMNTAGAVKKDGFIYLNETVRWPARKDLPDGNYTVGLRPYHVYTSPLGPNDLPIQGTVSVSELSGSESIIHFNAFGNAWISLSHGIHAFLPGEETTMYIDVASILYFDTSERLVVAPTTDKGPT